MKKSRTILIVAFAILFFFVSSVQAYKPGDEIHVTYDPHLNIATKPKFVRYTLFDPAGGVVFEEDHQLTFVKQLDPFGIFWVWSDEYDIRVPAFAMVGEWKIQGKLFSEALRFIELPDLFPIEKKFMVEETGFFENLLAPWYFTYDGGIMVGRTSLSSPVHPLLILIVIAIIIILIFVVKMSIDVLIPKKGGNKK